MRLPQRVGQHITEDEALKAVQRVLPSQWIIREATGRDYGIDLYVELVSGSGVSGDLVALQVKGIGKIKFKNGKARISGIKRATLNYWFSFPVPVFLLAVCVETKRVFWANVKRQYREGRFTGDGDRISIAISETCTVLEGSPSAFRRQYFEEKSWPDAERAIEKSLMLFDTFGPLVLMCVRGDDKVACSTTIQYLINQHYDYYLLLHPIVRSGKPKSLEYWYSLNREYTMEQRLPAGHAMYFYVLKRMIESFAMEYRDAILEVDELVTITNSSYFRERFPHLSNHLKHRPHTFVEADWFARFYFDEYERETKDPEKLYFADFTEYDGVLDEIGRM